MFQRKNRLNYRKQIKVIKMKTIYNFKRGDEIVRVARSKPYQSGITDGSYMGEKLMFVGIANGQIYFKHMSDFSLAVFGDRLFNLSLDLWDEGWDYYFDPNKLLEGFEPELSVADIEEQIQMAINNEDYELAEKLKKRLK